MSELLKRFRACIDQRKPCMRALVLACLVLVNCSGCATGYLWSESDMAGYNEPVPANRLALCDAPEQNDVLAQYDECPSGRGAPRRRAYFVFENAQRTVSAKQPRFVSLTNSSGLVPIPLYRTAGASTNMAHAFGLQAIQTENPNRFTLVKATGESLGTFDLPTYHAPFWTAKCLALTPLTVAVDATIIGSIAFGLYAYARVGGQALN